MIETKCLINSTISDAKYNARFMCADITNYFLATPMTRKEYMRVYLRYFPADIIAFYSLNKIVTCYGFIYIEIHKGMYGLKKTAAILAYKFFLKNILPFGYVPVKGTVGLWKHKKRRTKFCVCVDDFDIKSLSNNDRDHLLNALKAHYKITVDLSGSNYCGMTFNWCYNEGYVDISMPQYIRKALARLNHTPTKVSQPSPHAHVPFRYVAKGTQ